MPKAATAVNLVKKFKTAEGWKVAPVEFNKNGKIRLDSDPTLTYYIEWREDGKRTRKAVGKNATDAVAARDRQMHLLSGAALGMATPVESNGNGTRPVESRQLATAIAQYVAEVKANRKHKTYLAYNTALNYFLRSCKKTDIAEVTRQDLLNFKTYCRETLKLSPRTCANQYTRVVTFFIAQGFNMKDGLWRKGDVPQFVEEDVEVYEPEELETFFAACTEEERVMFSFFLMTGMREQEVIYTHWNDIKLDANTVRVSYKAEHGFSPKAYKGREIPIPDKLVALLRKWQAKRDLKCPLLFPTSGCNPYYHFLETCKEIAERAELPKESFFLHKFRATFATRHLQTGVDLRTVQAWMGHSDLQSTLRYLKPARGAAVRQKVNETFG